MPDDLTLQLEPRSVTGKKVRRLRREGIIPGNVYGRGRPSVAVQASLLELRRVFRGHDRNQVVNAQISGESDTRPVVLRDVQRHPVTHDVEHVDLYHIDLTRAIHSTATVHIVGDDVCPAITLGGVLVQGLGSVMLEALPMDMPSDLTIDVSGLEHFGQSMHVSDLALPDGVRALAEPTAQLATIIAPRLAEEDEVEEAAAEGVEGEEGAEEAAADGAAEAAAND
jgi:large subunit ribosomal protein L25